MQALHVLQLWEKEIYRKDQIQDLEIEIKINKTVLIP